MCFILFVYCLSLSVGTGVSQCYTQYIALWLLCYYNTISDCECLHRVCVITDVCLLSQVLQNTRISDPVSSTHPASAVASLNDGEHGIESCSDSPANQRDDIQQPHPEEASLSGCSHTWESDMAGWLSTSDGALLVGAGEGLCPLDWNYGSCQDFRDDTANCQAD